VNGTGGKTAGATDGKSHFRLPTIETECGQIGG